MGDSLVEYGKIVAKSAFKWLVIFFSGLLFSAVGTVIGFVLLNSSDGGGVPAAGHAGVFGAAVGLWYLLLNDFWPTLLIISSLLIFPVLYFILANKSTIQYVIYQVASNKLAGFISDRVEIYAKRIEDKPESKLKNISDFANVKLQLVNSNKQDKAESKWQRRAVAFILNRIDLSADDISSDTKLSKLMASKTHEFIDDFTQPSSALAWLIFGAHFLLIICAILFS